VYAGAPPMTQPPATVTMPTTVMYAPRSAGVAYLLWFLSFIGLCGMHRFYAGKWVTGIIWLLTGGLLFIGQFVDLFLIPQMIKLANLESAFEAQAIAGRQMAAAARG